jgi:hypothetical protein
MAGRRERITAARPLGQWFFASAYRPSIVELPRDDSRLPDR